MFVDTAKVKLKAGKGGDGAVSFRHEIYIPKGGPDGGDGGRGGSIIFRADKDTNTLIDFRLNPEIKAENGKNGSGQRSAGRSGKDTIVEVPIGTLVKRDGMVIADLTHDQEEAVIAKGGDGGFGNAHFKSSTRQTPTIAEVGEPGDEFEAELELKLLADVGLVGLPNAGKSTFLSVVSNATPEIADYPFTTLTPQLGVATIDEQDLLIADIPGLIEGAADGKGLGHEFLRHVERTKVLLHLIDVYNDDAGVAYQTIRHELENYGELAAKPEVVVLTKCEGVDQEIIDMQIASILQVNPAASVYAISAPAHQGIDDLLRTVKDLSIELDENHPVYDDPDNPPREGVEIVQRPVIHGFVYDPKSQKYLVVEYQNLPWINFISGGIEEGEDAETAARREIREETGYTDLHFERILGKFTVRYYTARKHINYDSEATQVLFTLKSDTQIPLSNEEQNTQQPIWLTEAEILADPRLQARRGVELGFRRIHEQASWGKMAAPQPSGEVTDFVANLLGDKAAAQDLPVISLGAEQLSKAWQVEKVTDGDEEKFVVTGQKIEKFARRTDLNNYASVNRLRDIMKKMGIRAELTSQGAEPESIISIAGKEFPLVEDW